MGDRTGIEWADATWNAITGCDRVSPGCGDASGGGCYAERTAMRLIHTDAYAGVVAQTDDGPRWTGRVNLLADKLDVPLRWRRPRRIFVNSMSDLFHDQVPDEFIAEVYARIALADLHQFQVLTKRPQRMARLLGSDRFREMWFEARNRRALEPDVQRAADRGDLSLALRWPIPNAWNGTSVETQRYAFRCRYVIGEWNAVPWVSAEPLLGALDLTEYLCPGSLAWVVVGGESGPRSRPMHPEWARSLRDQCDEAGVPFLFKQWGQWASREDGPVTPARGAWVYEDGSTSSGTLHEWSRPGKPAAMFPVGKQAAGRLLDGRTWDGYPR